MNNETTRSDGDTDGRMSGGGMAVSSDNVRDCPNGADGRFAPGVQVPAGLTDAQLRALELLLTGTSQAKVARACGVDVRTIYRWRHECEPFRAALDRARRDMWVDTMYRMRAMVATSLNVLAEQLVDEYDTSRVRAASIVLTHSNVRKVMQADMADHDG